MNLRPGAQDLGSYMRHTNHTFTHNEDTQYPKIFLLWANYDIVQGEQHECFDACNNSPSSLLQCDIN